MSLTWVEDYRVVIVVLIFYTVFMWYTDLNNYKNSSGKKGILTSLNLK